MGAEYQPRSAGSRSLSIPSRRLGNIDLNADVVARLGPGADVPGQQPVVAQCLRHLGEVPAQAPAAVRARARQDGGTVTEDFALIALYRAPPVVADRRGPVVS